MRGLLLILLSFFLLLISPKSFSLVDNDTEELAVQRVRISFTSPLGNIRPLLLGFTTDDAATDGFDQGYDAKNSDSYPNDMNWIIDDERYVIQGVGSYNTNKFYELGVYLNETGDMRIALDELENFNAEIPVYIYDAEIGDYTQINESPFMRYMTPGTYRNRFFIAFSENSVTLGDEDINFNDFVKIFSNDGGETLTVKSTNLEFDKISIYTISSQKIFESKDLNVIRREIPVHNYKNIPLFFTIDIDGRSFSRTILISD